MGHRIVLVACVMCSGAFLFPVGIVQGAKKSDKPDPARDIVEKVLLKEVDSTVDRRVELAKALRRQPDSELLRWQSGYVRAGNTWQAVEDAVPSAADAPKFDEYRRRRERVEPTAAGQLELADWCRQHGLPDQERAHLSNLLSLSPGWRDPAVFKRLGYKQVANQWLSEEQLAEWRDTNQRSLAALKKWEPQLSKISEQIANSPKRHGAAWASLRKVSSADSIPAIEYVVCGANEPAALLAVESFRDIAEYEGTVALAKQAVFSKWQPVRAQAAAALKYREQDDFVPALIRLLALPAKGTTTTPRLCVWSEDAQTVTFVLVVSYMVARETDDQFQASVLNTLDFRINQQMPVVPRPGTPPQNLEQRVSKLALLRSEVDFQRELDAIGDWREDGLEEANKRTQELNGRIINVLSSISGRSADPDVRSWWQWWGDQTETEREAAKPVIAEVENEVVGSPTSRVYRKECFAAGTPVWTDRGRRPIEQIRVGDRVLSQDVESGELAYESVIATSVRAPRELVRLTVGKEQVTSTGGHRYWVSGKRWVKARDLWPDMRIHTVTGSVAPISTETAPAAETYNLVVADSHTYFVGDAGMLVQDLPMPRSTNRVVPGLARRKVPVRTSMKP